VTDGRRFPAGTRVDDLDLSGVHLHGTMLDGARLTDTSLVGATITGDVEGLQVNGVEVEPLVRAELERRHPELARLRATDLGTLRAAWSALEDLWSATTARALRLGEERLRERVDGEWSFMETLRHLVFATEAWVTRGIHGVARPYNPKSLPWGGVTEEWARAVGVDLAADPSLAEVLAMREEGQASARRTLGGLDDAQLLEVRSAPDGDAHPTGDHTVRHCVHVLLNEEWWHHRYAVRDLDVLDPGGAGPGGPAG
jgi:hypothetical protein